jgi:lambda repressor-like predicted transcriptional regulator
MSFRENMKEALDFKGMLVKELADKTKISRRTLDNYLRSAFMRHSAVNIFCDLISVS